MSPSQNVPMIRKLYKHALCLLLTCLLCLCTSGCSLGVNVDTMLMPPRLSSEQEQIYQALQKTTGSGIRLKYPKSGDYLSAFIVADIDNDQMDEAIVFYEKKNAISSEAGLRMNVLDRIGGEWLSVCDRSAEGSEIEKVIITRLGTNERTNIIVGYSTANQSEKYVSVYAYDNTYLDLTFSQSYAHFDVNCMLRADQPMLVLLGSANALTQAYAAVYRLDAEGLYHEHKYLFTDNYTGYSQLLYEMRQDNSLVFYVDAASGTSELRTEILSFDGEKFTNLLHLCGRTAADTVRRAGLLTTDIDQDGTPEIPVQSVFKGYEDLAESEQIPMTRWLMMREDVLYAEHDSFYNAGSGYAFMLPEHWKNTVTVVKDPLTDEVQICVYQEGKKKEELPILLRIHIAYDDSDLSEHLSDGYHLLHTKGTAYYLIKAESEHAAAMSAAELMLRFRFL